MGTGYLPVLEALSRLGRGPAGPTVLGQLRRWAPTWLAQLTGVVPAAEQARLQRRTQGTTRERMLRELAEALAVLEASERGDLLAETYRLRGALLLAQGGPRHPAKSHREEAAEACFQQALAITRRQQAKAWELRAAMSLSRLWQQQGKCQAAQNLLRSTYSWVTEGLDTADLQEAKALLATLSCNEQGVKRSSGL